MSELDIFKIELKSKKGDYSNGKIGATVFFTITNNLDYEVEVKLISLKLFNGLKHKMVHSRFYLNGYEFDDEVIPPHSSATGSKIFLDKDIGPVAIGKIYAHLFIEDLTHKKPYFFHFRYDEEAWTLIFKSNDPSKVARELNGNIAISDKKINIIKMNEIEKKLNIKLDNINYTFNRDLRNFTLFGEFKTDNYNYGKAEIVATYYDKDNKIIGRESTFINLKDFTGFETFSIKSFSRTVDLKSIRTVKIYPKIRF